jgi:hypothetical protein
MAIANYSDLQSAVLAWVVRTGDTESTTRVPDFIRLFEAEANRRIRVRHNMTTTALTLTSGTSAVTLPAGFLEEIELNYTDNDARLSRASFDTIDRARNVLQPTGQPALYAISGTQILFERSADADYALLLRYYAAWDIASDTTNWLLTYAPDAYLFGAVAEAAMFVRDDQLLSMAMQRRDAAIREILNADHRNKNRLLSVDNALQAGGSYDYRSDR